MKNKNAMMGEKLLMIYRLILIAFIALIVLGIAAIFYDYYLDVRDAEARIVAKEVVNCLAPEGVVDLSRFEEVDKNLLEVCGFDSGELDRFYINASIVPEAGEARQLEQGDPRATWVYEFYLKDEASWWDASTEHIAKYKPGHWANSNLDVIVQDGDEKQSGKIKLRVFVNHEF